MIKGKAFKRALQTNQAYRVLDNGKIPLITDCTELITPEKAQEYLTKNKYNRPINWKSVEKYCDLIQADKWLLTPQGIVFDNDNDLINGQNRLWAIIYANTAVYMRVSRGVPAHAAAVLDRGRPQTARDLATRQTTQKHKPIEATIAKASLALAGIPRPNEDVQAAQIVKGAPIITSLFEIIKGAKKSKAAYMILGAICTDINTVDKAQSIAKHVEELGAELENQLKPATAGQCWGKGAAFVLAMEKARSVVHRFNQREVTHVETGN